MIRVNRWTTAALTATSLMIALLIAGTSILQAATVEHRAVNKLVKDFPEKADLSAPESVMATAARHMARLDIKAASELSWGKQTPEKIAEIEQTLKHDSPLPKDYGQLVLDSEIIEVLTYNDDLAAVICKSGLPEGPFGLELSGRIDGEWKAFAVPGFEGGHLPSVQATEERFEKEKDDLWRKFVDIRNDVKNGRTPQASALRKAGYKPPPSLSAAEKESIKRWQDTTWRIGIDLDMPSLEPQAVQYAIFDKDPVAAFTAEVKKMQGYFRKDSEKLNNAAREQLQVMRMAAWWDTGFKEIPGNSVWLLTRLPGQNLSHNPMSSSAPDGKKWVVTKTVSIHGKPECWCIPVEVKTGEQVDVTLDENDTFDLQAAYDKAVRGGGAQAAAPEVTSKVRRLQNVDVVVQQRGVKQRLASLLDAKLGDAIAKISGVKQVSAGLVDFVSMNQLGPVGVLVEGYDADSPLMKSLDIQPDGRCLAGGDKKCLLLGERLAASLGKKVGDKLKIYDDQDYSLVGIFKGATAFENGGMVVLLEDLQQLTGRKGKVGGFAVIVEHPEDKAEIQRIVHEIEALGDNVEARATAEVTK
jgi:hypothetical protein